MANLALSYEALPFVSRTRFLLHVWSKPETTIQDTALIHEAEQSG